MAHIEIWWRCPVCKKAHDTCADAIKCRNSHPIVSERWAVGNNEAAYKINKNVEPGWVGSEEWAMKLADKN